MTCPSCIPWQVGAIYKTSGKLFCGGSILSPKYVMSAAHCFSDGNNLPTEIDSIEILAGATNLSDPEATRHDLQHIFEHPSYNQASKTYAHDFAILKLKGEIGLGPKARQICLPKPGVEFDRDTEFVQSGWGLTEDGETYPDYLKHIVLNWVSPEKCESLLEVEVDESTICAAAELNVFVEYHGTCTGDSGGMILVFTTFLKLST